MRDLTCYKAITSDELLTPMCSFIDLVKFHRSRNVKLSSAQCDIHEIIGDKQKIPEIRFGSENQDEAREE